jgi:hypothetical protein
MGITNSIELYQKKPFIFAGSHDLSRLLVFDLAGLSLDAHPLMINEITYALALKKLLKVLEVRKRKNIVWFYNEKVVSLRSEFCNILEKFKQGRRKSKNKVVIQAEKSAMIELCNLLKEIKSARLLRVI